LAGVFVRLLDYYPRDVCVLAVYARVTASHRLVGELSGAMGRGECLRWLRAVIVHGYTSVLEHTAYTFEARCSRVCSHQLVRHRHASYTQQSMRRTEALLRRAVLEACRILGVECPEKPRTGSDYERYAWVMEKLSALASDAPEEAYTALAKAYTVPAPEMLRPLARTTADYYHCLAQGAPREECRYILPQAARTEIVFTMNARELLEVFLPLRTCRKAHREIRSMAWSMWLQLLQAHPEIYAYTGPRCLHQAIRTLQKPLTLKHLLRHGLPPAIHCPEGLPGDRIPTCLAKTLTEAGITPEEVEKQLEEVEARLGAAPVEAPPMAAASACTPHPYQPGSRRHYS